MHCAPEPDAPPLADIMPAVEFAKAFVILPLVFAIAKVFVVLPLAIAIAIVFAVLLPVFANTPVATATIAWNGDVLVGVFLHQKKEHANIFEDFVEEDL